jgi:hypothetical protein
MDLATMRDNYALCGSYRPCPTVLDLYSCEIKSEPARYVRMPAGDTGDTWVSKPHPLTNNSSSGRANSLPTLHCYSPSRRVNDTFLPSPISLSAVTVVVSAFAFTSVRLEHSRFNPKTENGDKQNDTVTNIMILLRHTRSRSWAQTGVPSILRATEASDCSSARPDV